MVRCQRHPARRRPRRSPVSTPPNSEAAGQDGSPVRTDMGGTEMGHGDGGPVLRTFALEIGAIVVLSIAMLLLPVVQIAARILGKDVPGASVYTPHATLWLGFLGALAATAGGRHLGLATANFLRPGRVRTGAQLLSAAVSTVTAILFTYASWRFIDENRVSATTLAGGVPEWWSELIVPVAAALIALRFILRAPGGWRGSLAIMLVGAATIGLFSVAATARP